MALKVPEQTLQKPVLRIDAVEHVHEEIEDLATLSDEQYEKRMGTIRKRYSRIPVGESFIQTAALKEGVNVKNDRAVSSKAAEIASKMGKDFGEVLRQLQNGEI